MWQHEPNNIFTNPLIAEVGGGGGVLPVAAAQELRQADGRGAGVVLLFGGDLRSLPGDGVLHGLQLLQQLLAAGQCVAGFVGARRRAGRRGGRAGSSGFA